MKLDIPSEVLAIASTLEDAGFETWCVGGAVRDNLLGQVNKDFDLATAATPSQVRRLFRRTVPIGIEHGTVAVLDEHGRPHEVTTFREDVRTDGRHAEVEFGVSLDEDLARRDFTINAIAYHPLSGEWSDPFGGRQDLERGLVRAVGDPTQRFREDYLRILRAARFTARFGFTIDEGTWNGAKACVDGLRHLSAERVRDEWFKGLESARRVSEFLELWRRLGAGALWLPELDRRNWSSVPDGMRSVDRITARDPVLLTAYLAEGAGDALARLRCSNAQIDRGRAIDAYRRQWPDTRSERDVRRWMAAVGDRVDDLLAVAAAEETAHGLRAVVERVRASGAPLRVTDLAVTGDDLLALGIPTGPLVGTLLQGLFADVLDDPSRNQREILLGRVKQRWEEAGRGRAAGAVDQTDTGRP